MLRDKPPSRLTSRSSYTITIDLYADDELIRRIDLLNVPQIFGSASQMYDWISTAIQALQGTVQY